MAVVLIKARRTGLTTLASFFAKRKESPETPDEAILAELGLTSGWSSYPALAPLLRPHFKPGTRVQVIAQGAAKYLVSIGDLGTVTKVAPACGMHDKVPDDDLYFVLLDAPKTDKKVAYLRYKELKAA